MKIERIVIAILIVLVIAAVIVPSPIIKPGKAKPPVTSNDNILTVIHERRSVRDYTGEPVSMEEVHTLIKAAFAAPTSLNAQPWYFIVVTDRKTLDRLANVVEYGKMLKKVPVAIAVCGKPAESAAVPHGVPETWIMDCAAASQNILLAARGLGLGTVWIGAYPDDFRIKGITNILELPEGVIPLNLIAVGRPTDVDKPKDKYKPEKIFSQQWGKQFDPEKEQ